MIAMRLTRGRLSSQRTRSRVKASPASKEELCGRRDPRSFSSFVAANRVLLRIASAYLILLMTIRMLFEHLHRTNRLIFVTHQYRAFIRYFRSMSIDIPILGSSTDATPVEKKNKVSTSGNHRRLRSSASFNKAS
jgi:hypothetical protein